MAPGFTQPATERLAQLARNAFEEEQYDLAVHCISQLASLGWHPTSDLIRCLFAISMCDLPESSLQVKKAFKSNGKLPKLSSRVAETSIGPEAECIWAATRLLEHVGKVAGYDIIFAALLPVAYSSNRDEDESEANRQQSRYFSVNGRGEEEEEDGNSSNSISVLRTYTEQIKKCESFWQVLALGDMMNKAIHKKNIKVNKNDREGEEETLCNDVFDREAVWRIMDLILECWNDIDVADKDQMSKFAPILVPNITFQKTKKKQQSASNIHASTDIGEAFEVIYAGLSPTSLLCQDDDIKMSRKSKIAQRYQRGSIAVKLLTKLFSLVPMKLVDRDAMLTRIVHLLKKIDFEASRLVFQAMRRASFEDVILMAGLMCIDWTDDEQHLKSELERYTESFEDVELNYDGKGDIYQFLKGIECFDWFFPLREDYYQSEGFLMEFLWRDGHTSIEKARKNQNISALLDGSWSVVTVPPKVKEDPRSNVLSPSALSWENLAYATTWRKATMQLHRNFVGLQMEVIKTLKIKIERATKKRPVIKTTHFSTASMKFLIEEYESYRLKRLRSCCSEMSTFLDKKRSEGVRPNSDREKMYEKLARQNVKDCINILELMTNEMQMIKFAITEEGQGKALESRSSDEVQMSI